MIRGPQEYVPSVELEVVNKQKAIPLDENEGIYVRDIKTGKVYTVVATENLFHLFRLFTLLLRVTKTMCNLFGCC